MASCLNQIHFNDIPVSNLEYSLEWYQSFLGFDVQYMNDDIGILRLERGSGLILTRSDIRSSKGKSSMEGKAAPMIGFETLQMDKLYRFLRVKAFRLQLSAMNALAATLDLLTLMDTCTLS